MSQNQQTRGQQDRRTGNNYWKPFKDVENVSWGSNGRGIRISVRVKPNIFIGLTKPGAKNALYSMYKTVKDSDNQRRVIFQMYEIYGPVFMSVRDEDTNEYSVLFIRLALNGGEVEPVVKPIYNNAISFTMKSRDIVIPPLSGMNEGQRESSASLLVTTMEELDKVSKGNAEIPFWERKPRTETKPTSKSSDTAKTEPEVKPEIKSEPAPEVKVEAKLETKAAPEKAPAELEPTPPAEKPEKEKKKKVTSKNGEKK